MKIVLINPNTSRQTTEQMVNLARSVAGSEAKVDGLTASSGARLITDEAALATATDAVNQMINQLNEMEPEGVLISAFGDPGLELMRAACFCPVVGIAEASMVEAARDGRRFSVATTTPDLVGSIRKRAEFYGFGEQLITTRITEGDPASLMSRSDDLIEALFKTVREAVELDGAEAVIIGGGPLGDAARDLSEMFDVPIIEPIPAGIRMLLACHKAGIRTEALGHSNQL